MKKIDIAKLTTKRKIKQAIKDYYKLSFIDFCIKYRYSKGDIFKVAKHIKKLEKGD